jgi:hypothetical protein
MTYPPEPWDLHGHAYVGIWLLRSKDARALPQGIRVIRLLGLRIVAAAFVVYEEPSPLTYHELMWTQHVRQGRRPRVSITDIWVDGPDSRDGGRALWAIPKDLADFEVEPHVSYTAVGLGSLQVRRRRMLPGRWPFRFSIAQDRDGSALVSPVTGKTRLGIVRGVWTFARDGQLGFLAGRRPWLTLAFGSFRMLFGRH